jgi:4-aminobutyrate aminotransferase-like enzyme
MASPGRIRMRRPGTPGPRGGGVFVTEVQGARLLDATVAVVSELGYKQMTVRSRVRGLDCRFDPTNCNPYTPRKAHA